MRLAMLAPDIIESVIRGDYPANISVNSTRKSVPDLWEEQRRMLLENQWTAKRPSDSDARRPYCSRNPRNLRPLDLLNRQ